MPRAIASRAADPYFTTAEPPPHITPEEREQFGAYAEQAKKGDASDRAFFAERAAADRAALAPAPECGPSDTAALERVIAEVLQPLLDNAQQALADAQPRLDKAQAAMFAAPSEENQAELEKCQLQLLGAPGNVALAQAAIKQARELLPMAKQADALRASAGPDKFMADLKAKMIEVRTHLDAAAKGMKEAFDLNAQHVKTCTDALNLRNKVATKLTDIHARALLKLPNRFGQPITDDAVVSASARAIGDALRTSGLPLGVVHAIESTVRWQG